MVEGPACLIVGPAWVGDMVMAQCLTGALLKAEPELAIDVMAPGWTAPIINRMPEVRGALEMPFDHGRLDLAQRWRQGRVMRGRYARAFVLPNSFKSALTPFFAGIARRTGYLGEQRYGLINDIVPLPGAMKRRTAARFRAMAGEGPLTNPRLQVDTDNQNRVCQQWGLAPGEFVALAPGSEFGPSKRWPAEKYAALARHFAAGGWRVVVLGSARDGPVAAEVGAGAGEALDLTGKTGLGDAIDLIGAARLAVTNDSGLMHVAAAVNVPTVAIFGSTSPADTPPLSPLAMSVAVGVPCAPCFKRTCPLGHTDCMNTLGIEQVLEASERVLQRVESGIAAV